MNKYPIPMIYQTTESDKPLEVDVYDFIHNTFDPLDSHALCWVKKSSMWLTVAVANLTPITDKKQLTE